MLSTDITVYSKNNAFVVPVEITDKIILMEFDTGAVNTVISAELVFKEMSELQRSTLRDHCSKHCSPVILKSASGHKILGYPVITKNVLIDGVIIPILRYYMVIDRLFDDCKIALLGNDIIRYCKFLHEINGNIKITVIAH